MKIDVHMFDTVTGERRTYQPDYEEEPDLHPEPWCADEGPWHGIKFMWGDGNFACDCNRGLFWAWSRGEEDPERSCSSERYLVKILDRASGELIYEDDDWREPSIP